MEQQKLSSTFDYYINKVEANDVGDLLHKNATKIIKIASNLDSIKWQYSYENDKGVLDNYSTIFLIPSV